MVAYFNSFQPEIHVHTQELKFYSVGSTLYLHYDYKSVNVKVRPVTCLWKYRGETRHIAVPILNLGAGGWCVFNAKPLSFYPLERDPVPIVQDAGWVAGPVSTGVENIESLSSTRAPTPTCPARSESLHRLHYSGPQTG
jgi:hypothetical protein